MPHIEKLFIRGDFKRQLSNLCKVMTMCKEALVEGGIPLLNFARAFWLMLANLNFSKEEHLFTYRSMITKIQIDYLLSRKGDKDLCKDCTVISSKNLMIQHKT